MSRPRGFREHSEHSIGRTHARLYEALVQIRPVTVIRDYDRDAFLDFYNGVKQTGNFGIEIHRAESIGTTKLINKYSAGCQVFQNANDFFRIYEVMRSTSQTIRKSVYVYTG